LVILTLQKTLLGLSNQEEVNGEWERLKMNTRFWYKKPNGIYPSQIFGSAREYTAMWDKLFNKEAKSCRYRYECFG
jgi:hypothetical protein